MTPLFIGLANDEDVVLVKRLPPKPGIHWLWKVAYFATFGGAWLALLVGVLWSG
jgi:hypothetical protein